MRKNKRIWLSAVLALTMMVGMAGCNKKVESVATINGEPLSIDTYKAYLFIAKLNFEQISGPGIWDIEMDGESMEQVAKERALESAIAMSVTSKKAKEMKVELSAEDKDYAKQSAAEFITELGDQLEEGVTEDVIRKMMEEILLSQKVSVELANRFVPTEDVEGFNKFVEENKAYFEQVKAQHVLISALDESKNPLPEEKQKQAKEKAEEILKKALAGEDMGSLAKEYSEDPGSKDNNGEYTFPRGQMVPEFEEAAFSGEEGKVYPELVHTTHGYHIIKTVEKIAADENEMKQAFEENQKAIYVNSEIDEWIKGAQVEKTPLYDTVTIKRATEENTNTDETPQDNTETEKTDTTEQSETKEK